VVSGSVAGAGGGMLSGHTGSSSSLTRLRSARGTRATASSPTTRAASEPARRPIRAARSTVRQRLASASAAASSRSVRWRARNSLIIAPVSIASGHEGAQVPSAAQVSMPSYSYSRTSAS
jgi:hypothetical protein